MNAVYLCQTLTRPVIGVHIISWNTTFSHTAQTPISYAISTGTDISMVFISVPTPSTMNNFRFSVLRQVVCTAENTNVYATAKSTIANTCATEYFTYSRIA